MKKLGWILVAAVLVAAALVSAAPAIEDELIKAQQDAGSWLSYGRNYSGWRYSPLTQIQVNNISQLAPAWVMASEVSGNNETTPLVRGDMMYLTGPSNYAWAVDLHTGRKVWTYSKAVPTGVGMCCGPVNRGVAIRGDRVFKMNLEATLVALEAKSGRVLWETVIDEYKKGYSATTAPLVVKDMVVTGIAGAEYGIRGYVDAYDAATGKRRWRTYTVPTKGEPGVETWGGESYKQGGGSTWITGTYDPELNLIYWGTGNPAPDLDGDVRPGDNLYTNSLLALDADTGKIKWHFQFTPHDVHDWDATEDPVLIDLKIGGKDVKAVVQANRNGFYYALDRATGKMLTARPYTKVTWADGIGRDGRPIVIAGSEPNEEGSMVCPGIWGGHSWEPTAYSPQSGLYYFGSMEGCQVYFRRKQEFVEGRQYLAGINRPLPKEPQTGAVIAVDPATGETRWRYEMVRRPAGMLATAGGLVFTGDPDGYLIALDARTGKVLWKFQTGAAIKAAPISYSHRGKQFIAVAAGPNLFAFKTP